MSIIYRCRLCLKSCRNKIEVFKDDFPKMIEILSGLKVDPCDDFPKTSCLDCAKNVKTALRTRKQIIQSHKTLLEEFLAKCREVTIFETEINKNQANITENVVSNETTKIKNNKLETRKCIRTRGRLKLSKKVEIKSEADNVIVTDPVKGEITVEKPILLASSRDDVLEENVQAKTRLIMDYNLDDSNSCGPPTPLLSEPTSDTDWVPDKDEPSKMSKQETKPPRKPSDGVFFVKKLRSSSKNQKSTETIVRIKKKPKGQVPPRRVTCDICKREVQSYWLQKHMETHQYNPVTCEFCGLVSKSATALRHHVFYYHRSAADEYMCDQCGRSFRSKYRLNLHKKKEHGGTKDFECTTCGKKFFERMHLKRHIDKTHKNIRPYVCDFCGKSFKSKNHIKIHERIHSKEAPYNCHMCGESFKMKLMLRTHLKGVHNVHEEQKVFCDICKRGFASDVALKAHLNSRIHETEKCQYCSEMFTMEYMVNHLRDVHRLGDTS